jgi:hypothetical protein
MPSPRRSSRHRNRPVDDRGFERFPCPEPSAGGRWNPDTRPPDRPEAPGVTDAPPAGGPGRHRPPELLCVNSRGALNLDYGPRTRGAEWNTWLLSRLLARTVRRTSRAESRPAK